MIQDEDPATLIKATISNFNLAPDKAAMIRVQESLASLAEMRGLRVAEAEEALARLSRTESGLRAQHADKVAGHSATAHANAILALDAHKFRVAKAASDMEAEAERLGADLDGLRARLAELEMQGVEGDEAARERREADDPAVLKLKVFRSLGVEVETDAKTGLRRAVVRSSGGGGGRHQQQESGGKGDVHVVAIDPSNSKSYYANYFWDVL